MLREDDPLATALDRRIFDLVPAAIFVCDGAGLIRYYNRHAVALWGHAPARGERASDLCERCKLFEPGGRPVEFARTPMAVALLTGEPQRDRHAIMERGDGRRLSVVANADPIRDASGTLLGVITVFQEAPQREQADEAQHVYARYLNVLQALPAAVYTCDAEGRITFYNDTAVALWGRTPVLGVDTWCGSWRLYGEDGTPLPAHACPMALAVHEGRKIRGRELVIERPDGSRVSVLPHPEPIVDADGQVVGAINMLVDITSHKQAQEALRQSRERLRQTNETLELRVAERTEQLQRQTAQLRLLANELTVAEQRERQHLAQQLHDGLQQMLVAANMQVGLCMRRAEAGPLQDNLARIGRIIDDAIRSSRTLAIDLSPPILQDSSLADALVWLARHFSENHALEVAVDIDPAFPVVPENAKVLMFQAARELLLNAVKHAGVPTARVELDRAADGMVRLQVHDDGQGFGVDLVLDAHEPRGFGLLSIRERVEALGGTFTAVSAPDRGAHFALVLPSAAEEMLVENPFQPSATMDARERGDGEHGARILVVDDHRIVREGIIMLLEQHGFDVVGEASDGIEAVEQADLLQPDVVLMDINMPRLNGIEATRRILAMHPLVKIVALSLYDEDNIQRRMQSAGASAYVRKDDLSESLFETIDALGQLA